MIVEEMDLSGNKKNEALQALVQLFQRGLISIPFIRGMRNQLSAYALPDTKLAQDIVSMLMCAGRWVKMWRLWGLDESRELVDPREETIDEESRGPRRVERTRTVERPEGVR